MKRLFRYFSVMLVFGFFSTANTNSYAIEVLTVCDSITQGLQRTREGFIFGVANPVNGRANFGGYQPRLNRLLDAEFGPSNVYNWGIGGEISSQTVNRINNVLNSRSADYILILCGANDVLLGISSNTTRANIDNMVQKSLAKGVTPIVGELTPITSDGFSDFNIWSNYNPKIRAVATSRGAHIAYLFGKGNDYNASAWVSDMRKCWRGGFLCNGAPPYNSGDGLHLSNLGYRVMANIWFQTIVEAEEANVNIVPPILMPLIIN